MNITQMPLDLRAERDQIEEALIVLQRLAAGKGRRRGRPPLWMSQGSACGDGKRKPRVFSLATRKEMAAAQRRRWAARKASQT